MNLRTFRIAGWIASAALACSVATAQPPSAASAPPPPAALASAPASAPASGATVTGDFSGDRATAGGKLVIGEPVGGDLFAAGGTVSVLAAVAGDAVLAGGTLRVNGAVGHDVYAAGGRITIDAQVQGNLRIAGGSVDIGPQARIAGNVAATGGELQVHGPVGGTLRAGAGRVLINASIGGDVDVGTGSLELGPDARIAGRLRYASAGEVKRDPAARVEGETKRIEPPQPPRLPSPADLPHQVLVTAGWIWTGGLMLLAAVLAVAFPQWYGRVAEALQQRPWLSLLIGFIVLVCTPVAALLLAVTIIGLPVALLLLVLYAGLLLVGYVSTGIGLGRLVLARLRPGPPSTGWRVIAALLGVLLVSLAARIPYAGLPIAFALMLAGIGASVLPLRPAGPGATA